MYQTVRQILAETDFLSPTERIALEGIAQRLMAARELRIAEARAEREKRWAEFDPFGLAAAERSAKL